MSDGIFEYTLIHSEVECYGKEAPATSVMIFLSNHSHTHAYRASVADGEWTEQVMVDVVVLCGW